MPGIDRRAALALGAATLAVPPTRAATPAVQIEDPRMAAIVAPEAALHTLYEGGRWCEGPCWSPAHGGLVFSDVRADHIRVLGPDGAARILFDPSRNANGNTLDAVGRLVTCEHRTRRVVRREHDGRVTVLADAYAGRRLNSPNDVALGPDGALWFTDPVFGIRVPGEGIPAEPEQAARRVYRIPPGGGIEGTTDALDQPNGLAFAPDGRTLYVADAGAALDPNAPRVVLAFPVGDRLGPPRTFARLEAGVPDGLRVDAAGNLYAACIDSVRVYAPDGTLLGRVRTPTPAANLAFGGPDGRRLFITAGSSVHALDLRRPAARG